MSLHKWASFATVRIRLSEGVGLTASRRKNGGLRRIKFVSPQRRNLNFGNGVLLIWQHPSALIPELIEDLLAALLALFTLPGVAIAA